MLFSQIVGQEKAKRFLMGVIERERIPHAYLFTGISGIGKKSVATALTMALNCNDPSNDGGCLRCTSCRQIVGQNFPDFLKIEPDGQYIKIGQIRELNRQFGFAPISGKFRVCLVEQAEKMTEEAANSFLKILEEPPPANILILCATEPLDLLPTIVSRCQKVPFHPLSSKTIRGWLMHNIDIDDAAAEMLSKLSGGSLGVAIGMSEGDYLAKRQEWLEEVLDLQKKSKEEALSSAFEFADKSKSIRSGSIRDGNPGMMDMLGVWASYYRDLLLLKAKGSEEMLINRDYSHILKNVSRRIKIESLLESIFVLNRAQRDLEKNRNTMVVIESAVLNLIQLADS
jgi:DNA polymerase-3 subunit delta'